MDEALFLNLFQTIAEGNPDNRTETYENAFAIGAAIAVKESRRAREIIELMERLQDSPPAIAMANAMLSLRDTTDVDPTRGDEVARALRNLNDENQGGPYGTAFMVGLQLGLADKGRGKEIVKAFERSPRKDVLRMTSAMVEAARRSRAELGMR